MGQSTLYNVKIAGIASCVPKRIVSNVDDCPPSQRSERERLVRNIGIRTRRICPDWQCFSDLAENAAERLIEKLNWDKSEIDALIVVTQSPDYLIPATAIILQNKLGLPNSTIAFDVNLGCSGYPFGLHLLGSMIAAGGVKKGLLLVGDKSANIDDPLFSDAGTATAMEYSENASPMYFDLNSDGSGYKAIIKPVGGHREPFAPHHLFPTTNENGKLTRATDLLLDGAAVLSFSTQRIPPAVNKMFEYAGLKKSDVEYFIFHQANKIINETIRKKLGIEPEKVPSTLWDFGNTSSATLPLTISVNLHGNNFEEKCKVLLCGFGIGLSWGTCIADFENVQLLELIEA